jgi:hypothetical protein
VTPEDTRRKLANDTLFYAPRCLKIINKDAQTVALQPNAAQRAFEEVRRAQREAGKPQRILVLKARQVGISTWAQAILIQATTQHENQNAVVVAHDVETGNKLFRMGQTMYGHLPNIEDYPELKPGIRHHRRGRFMHFAPPGADAWKEGDLYPNSTYFVDTAGEFQAGRGGTYQLAHLSEFAFWERPLEKLTALLAGVPRQNPDSLVIIESTANGMGPFKDMWDEAEEGKSGWAPFFWPWWKEPAYALDFANDFERKDFENKVGLGKYGEDEPRLLELGVTLEQLHWRRMTIATEMSGRVDLFHQEYPSTPEEAFIASGRQVFDPEVVKGVLVGCDKTDPRTPDEENPGPLLGGFKASGTEKVISERRGEVERPTGALWVPREDLLQRNPWKLWVPLRGQDEPNPGQPKAEGRYVIGVDASGGEMSEGASTPAYHSIEVINHKTREQVAEYRSHVDPDVLAELVYLAAKHIFNEAWVAVEITGGWGLPIVRRLFHDFHYPFVYIRKQHSSSTEDQSKMIGWHTTQQTKPIIEANMAQMLREGSHGVKSRDLTMEMFSYVRDDKGRTGPEAGRFSDLLIAYMIAQQVANEYPMRLVKKGFPGDGDLYAGRDPITGY